MGLYSSRFCAGRKTIVNGVEMLRKVVTRAQAGDDVGVLLKDVEREHVQRGDLLLGADSDFTWKP